MIKTFYRWPFIAALSAIASVSSGTVDSEPLKSESNKFSPTFDAEGRINLDADHFDGIHIDPNENQTKTQKKAELRRARLTFRASLNDNWSSKLQIAIDGNDDSYELKDAYIRYRGLDFTDIKIGQIKEPFSLESVTSSANNAFIERSLLSPLSLGRSKGINFANSNQQFSWSLGKYKVEKGGNIESDGDHAYTARVTYSPINNGNMYNHIGASFTKKKLLGAKYDLKSNGGVNSSIEFLNTSKTATDSIEQAGIEGAWGRGALSVQAEYQHFKINAVDSQEDSTYQGHYAQLSYFLTQDHRPYKKGRFASVKPSSASGAWEIAFRYSALQSIHVGNSDNSNMEIVSSTLALNYYLNKRIKLMLNAVDIDTTGVALEGLPNTGEALSMRIQLKL